MSNNSHSVDTQDHKPPPLSEQKVPAVLACLAEWFPQAFVPEKYLPHRPLKIGIHVDLQARCPALSELERGAVLHWYVTRTMYLRAWVAGASRIDLDGNVCGEVTAAEAQHAAARLAGIAYSTLWGWMKMGTFPRALELGPADGRSTIAWYADEVHDWITTRPRRKLGQHEFRGWPQPARQRERAAPVKGAR